MYFVFNIVLDFADNIEYVGYLFFLVIFVYNFVGEEFLV